MNIHLRAISAIVKKDVLELLPLVIITIVAFLLQSIIAVTNYEGDADFWATLQANFYWIGYFLGTLLMVSVLQQDPAASLNHDWLTRPIARRDWLLAKLLFLMLTICIPVVLSRFLINLSSGYDFGLSMSYALGIEKLPGVLPIPLFFAIALLTPSLRKAIFLVMLVLFVFLIPAWSATRPLLEKIGINLGSAEFTGMGWVQSMPMLAAGISGSLLIYWFFYCRRDVRRAYFVFCASIAIFFFTVFPPSSLYNWNKAIALHEFMYNGKDESLEDALVLKFTQACFPAAIGGNNANSGQNDLVLAQAFWFDKLRNMSDAGGLTFATTVRARNSLVSWHQSITRNSELPIDWRIDHLYSKARYSADSLNEDVILRRSPTAVNRYAPMDSTQTDYWLIPPELVNVLANDSSTRLTIEYDMAILSPKPYELKTDGNRYDFPELGSCKAEIDENANSIEVECVKAGTRPELMSAQLIGLDDSRVDSANWSNFTADWLEVFGRTQSKLTLESPDLVDSTSVMLIAYNVERIVHKEITSEGMLGESLDICSLPGDEQFAAIERSNWSDKSPHEVSSVAVDRGVRVEVLDWRNGETKDAPNIFLLPGLGATVHSFDEVAPKLAEKYNVVGMTRRGAGASSTPDHGYDIARLSQDVLEVLDTLEIESPILVGMSIAGEELSYLGANFPDRFSGLVYLDAAYDRTLPANKKYRDLNLLLPGSLPMRPQEGTSYQAMQQYAERRGRPRNIPEGEIIASYDLTSGQIKHNSLYLDAVMMGLQAPDYKNIAVPALGVYALAGSPEFMMESWYDENDPVIQQAVQELYQIERGKVAAIELFDTEIPDSEVLILEDGYHWVFLSHEQEVLTAIDEFIKQLTDQTLQ
ncbi:MAG: hypothetical protein COA96_02895 [SAR86 cluster bacterium]|uniref:AB hydrolase-1 domain-containing protein n=1 Tax=SAR86 cluster bacterium TaxID=2030880 RepID=A0A2A5B7I1_9GAMM|nr:MAG: hypothetical protein COA96_02895 [SAR86 cluster bacterium]